MNDEKLKELIYMTENSKWDEEKLTEYLIKNGMIKKDNRTKNNLWNWCDYHSLKDEDLSMKHVYDMLSDVNKRIKEIEKSMIKLANFLLESF